MTLKEWLQEDFSVTMSSGFFGFFAHCGVAHVLEKKNLNPKHVSGSSAGALVAGCWAGGVSLSEMRDLLFSLKREDFWDPRIGLGLLKGKLFDEKLRSFIPHHCFSKSKIPISLSAFDAFSFKTKVLESGDLVNAIRASCAVPIMFQPVWINKKPLLDGGIRDHAGLQGMPKENRVFYHHLLPRGYKKKALQKIPKRKNMVTLVLKSLPKVGPYQLENGPSAYKYAHEAMEKAMNMPIEDGQIVI